MHILPVFFQRRQRCVELSLLGVVVFLLVGCSGISGVSTPTTSPTSSASAGITGDPTTVATSVSTTAVSANWAVLESQPLHLPKLAPGAACPVTASRQHITPDHQYATGTGPVYLVGEALTNPIIFLDASSSDPGSSWRISKVFWEISASYTGPALIRGAQINGTHLIGFNGGLVQSRGNAQGTEPILHELRLLGDAQREWKTYLTFVRIQHAGCYALQIDGYGFSEDIIIQGTTS